MLLKLKDVKFQSKLIKPTVVYFSLNLSLINN